MSAEELDLLDIDTVKIEDAKPGSGDVVAETTPAPVADTPPPAADYASMSTVMLRTLVRERGFAKGAAVAVARKPDLIALLTGAAAALSAPVLSLAKRGPSAESLSAVATSIEIKLDAKTPTELKVLAFLKANASDVLAEKINAGKKTLAGALKFASGEARKLAEGAGMVCVDDETVFGWIIHYFEEESIKEEPPKSAIRMPSGVKPVATKKTPRKPKATTKEPPATTAPESPEPAVAPAPEPAPAAVEADVVEQTAPAEGGPA